MNVNGLDCVQVGEARPSPEGEGEDRTLEQQEPGQACAEGSGMIPKPVCTEDHSRRLFLVFIQPRGIEATTVLPSRRPAPLRPGVSSPWLLSSASHLLSSHLTRAQTLIFYS